MSSDPVSVLSFSIWDTIGLGTLGGRLWHQIIESVNKRIDHALFDQDWAWVNDRRYRDQRD